ncbi:MAG: tetratricopeptide repeat protein [Alphaproteobacteria bacterium]|nr:tetratricopeptide repeat protein [Alphaproteobacteria bacterium]
MLTVMLMLAAAPRAHAADAPTETEVAEARALYEQGVHYYERGEYETAIKLWRRSYDLTGHTEILHNIAKAWEEGGQPRSALKAWQEYLAVAPSEDERAFAETRIQELKLVVATLGEPAPAPAPAPVAVAPAPAPLPAPAPAPEPVPEEPRQKRSYRGLAVAGLAVGGAGAVTGGTVLSAVARGDATDTAQLGCVSLDGTSLCDADTASALRGDRLMFGVGLGVVGVGAALGTGAVVLAVSPKGERTVSVAMAPNGVSIGGQW